MRMQTSTETGWVTTAGGGRADGEVLVQLFSSLGHGFMHLLAAYYYVVALRLEREWGLSYADLLRLWTIGAALVGVMALPAGWLSDRWSARGMMAVFFLGLGVSAMLCAAATGPGSLRFALAGLGAFAAIYHPVGLPWLVRHARHRGRALGVNGIFGSLGVALAGVVAGGLSDLVGWRAAFAIPGAASVGAGVLMAWCIARGLVPESPSRPEAPAQVRRNDAPALWVLVFTMTSGALIYQATQAALPKMLAVTLPGPIGATTLGVGALVGLVYGVASLTQVAAGHFADRHSLPAVYLVTLFGQVPILWAMAVAGGWTFVAMAVAAVVVNTGALPAENLLLSESTPAHRQGLAFGLRFVLVFGMTPLSLWLVSSVGRATGGFSAVFWIGAALAAAAGVVALKLRTVGDARPIQTEGV
jgi:MFS family permease